MSERVRQLVSVFFWLFLWVLVDDDDAPLSLVLLLIAWTILFFFAPTIDIFANGREETHAHARTPKHAVHYTTE